ncbi:ATP-binding protein [Candidatus Neptunochlamydia vexilliferae]|uniref:ATPase n=1 Tax=Candidatus Neptunichlamydia vexilliferae TaxID=1651774 RepID=A0ABS0AX92_9BACT|nr:AAA family ATPase [Candidatus Neptunochlamydia vexilliferae]MBF5058754.1 hypothetical protein [Candidatus Neptunochlamydia vexilliferae]
MLERLLKLPKSLNQSFFLFGPRGTGKTWWVKETFPEALYIDLLDTRQYSELLAQPYLLETLIKGNPSEWTIIDEIQKVPQLLGEVHRLIESKGYKFILTGSSVRSPHKKGVNLLAGRALMFHMHPLSYRELGAEFNLDHSLKYGQLPFVYTGAKPGLYLETYINTHLRQEVLQEGLTRNLGTFSHMLEIASFSQGSVLNYSEIGREIKANHKLVESYFQIIDDLLIGMRLTVFAKRAKRRLIAHPKFYFTDVGIFRTLRPRGTLDSSIEIEGIALETLFLHELRLLNDYEELGYSIHFWRTYGGQEVDFILYGEKGFHAFEIKRSDNISPKDLKGLRAFQKDYPEAELYLIYGGKWVRKEGNILLLPFEEALKRLPKLLDVSPP